ncbi:MAG: protein kinase domain-containing protein [Pyrinomonadaceae bacterium]
MTPERWQQVDRLFQTAIELNPGDRAAFIDTSCAGDEELRNEVESLITSDEQGLSFIDDPAFEVAASFLVDNELELAIGQQLGNYQILSLLGTGGMGEVYLAEDANLGRTIALKLLPAEYTKDEERLRRFRQEARAASGLNHPNILTIHEINHFEGRYFIATEFVDGETLRQRMRRPRLSLSETMDIGIQVASALAAAHRAGIVHRDIKPENIMLRHDGYVKVLDFGLAKLTEQQLVPTNSEAPAARKVDTTPGVVMGTVKYMSPEQARGLEVDTRSDIFSFGAVLYEMITDRAPFEGETASDLIAAVLKEEPTQLKQHSIDSPDTLQRIISKALHKARTERYQTIRDLLIDLKGLKAEWEVESRLQHSEQTAGSSEVVTLSRAQPSAQTMDGLALSTRDVRAAPALLSFEYIVSGFKRHKIGSMVMMAALAVVVVGSPLALDNFIRRPPSPSHEMNIARISNTEKSVQAAISPDGKYVAHVVSGANQESLWVVHIATNSSVQIVPPANIGYGGLTFSRDGSYIFYAQNDGVLYQIPVLGGDAKKVLADVAGAISFAPDGQRFAFVRELNSEETALMVANVNGGGEQILSTAKKPKFLSTSGPAWSPDGSVIACAAGMTAGNREMSVIGIELATGQERQVTDQKWQSIERVAWLSDGSGLVAPATETGSGPVQIWSIPYPAGKARGITHDLNNYGDSSLTADSRSLVTIQFEQRNSLWIVPNGDPSQATPLTVSKHEIYRVISWTPDGRILYASNAGGGRDIWIMNGDGTNPKQLTANAGQNLQPYASPNGRYIVFLSNRVKTGAFNIWRMDIDGGNPIQLTHGSGEVQAICSPDGRWVVYSKGGPETGNETKTVWKVPIDGGEPVPLTSTPANGPAISPDGSLVACWYKQDKTLPWKIALIPLAGGPPIKTFDVTPTSIFRLRWTPDGQAITYINTLDGVSNIWSQSVNGGPPKQLTQFTSERIEGFDWSSDGHLICSRGYSARDVVLISNFRQ